MRLGKTEQFNLAISGENTEKPEWIPDIEWHGKMTPPLADFCTSMIAAGHPDMHIHELCKEWFGGPLTKKPIVALHDTHSHVIAEKIEQLSREMAQIPLAHKVYRMNLYNRMAMMLTDKFHRDVDESSPADAEKLTRAVAKVIGAAQDEMEGATVRLEQQNIYINAVNTLDLDKLGDLSTILENTYGEIMKALEEPDEAIDAEFEAVDDSD